MFTPYCCLLEQLEGRSNEWHDSEGTFQGLITLAVLGDAGPGA